MLTHYMTQKAIHHAHPELVAFHAPHLLAHFGAMMCAQIDATSCNAYVDARTSGAIGSRPVKASTARRELETLAGALAFANRDGKLRHPIALTYPAKAPPRDRWLSRPEAARLLAGALGWSAVAYDLKDRKPVLWRRLGRPSYHVARFILIGIYTGTRHEAMLRLRWGVNSSGGWVALDEDRIYRRGVGQVETNKRRPPLPIPPRLRPHLERARRLTVVGPIEYDGKLILKERTGFERAVHFAHLDGDVTPHVLKHTCATWMLQAGVPTWQVAGYLGTSAKVIEATYGHHSPDYMADAKNSFQGRNRGNRKTGA